MEDNFNQNDFEEFLQDQVKNHRMYPADSVWREIDKKLHGEKRWPALTIAAVMLLTATVLICVYFSPKPNIFAIQPAGVNGSARQLTQKTDTLNNFSNSVPFSPKDSKYPVPLQNSSADVAAKGDDDARDIIPLTNNAAVNSISAGKAQTKNIAIVKTSTPVLHITGATPSENTDIIYNANNDTPHTTASAVVTSRRSKANASDKAKAIAETSPGKDYNDKNMVDDFLKDHKSDVALHTVSKKVSEKNKFSYQIYVAPSVSYRSLLEDNSLDKSNNGGPVGLNYVTDVNKVVRHKPGTGIELGFGFMYNLSNTVRIKSGFQFNMRQYSIEAYRSNTELASIALVGSNGIDTVNSLSIYRNNNGYSSAELVNRYYQLSVPVGIEWQVIGKRRVSLSVAATIQPTYLLNRNAYLLSTNFKNYTESPGMVRQWNINSNIEAFISFKVGDFKWQLGPQLRYQPYSTFIPEYPIKEHLMDYGIKLGVSKFIN